MKYIDAEKLKAEIERLNSLVPYENNDRHGDGLHDAYKAVKNVITSLQQEQQKCIYGRTLEERKRACKYCSAACNARIDQEQPEVDLEKEYTEFVVADPVYSKLVNGIVGKAIARHFYELGLKARKA